MFSGFSGIGFGNWQASAWAPYFQKSERYRLDLFKRLFIKNFKIWQKEECDLSSGGELKDL